MTPIFLSTSDYFYVYLDIFLMGFHLSSTDRTGQEGSEGGKHRESIKEREKEQERYRRGNPAVIKLNCFKSQKR